MTPTTPFLLNENDIECMLEALHCVVCEYRGASDVSHEDKLIVHEDEIKQQIITALKILDKIDRCELGIFVETDGRFATIEFKQSMAEIQKLLEESRK